MRKKEGQSSIEFIIIFGAALSFFVVFFGIIQSNIEKNNLQKENTLLQNVALNIKDEINLASASSDGYFREFKIPDNILGKDYEVTINNNYVYASTNKGGFSYKVLEAEGQIKKGSNNITKQNGKVYLN